MVRRVEVGSTCAKAREGAKVMKRSSAGVSGVAGAANAAIGGPSHGINSRDAVEIRTRVSVTGRFWASESESAPLLAAASVISTCAPAWTSPEQAQNTHETQSATA